MSKVKELHDKAMELTEKAFFASRNKDNDSAIKYSFQAFLLEKTAAELIPNEPTNEPSRSILFRSAGWLAFNANDFNNARIMALKGLDGTPPNEIKIELEELYSECNKKLTPNQNTIDAINE